MKVIHLVFLMTFLVSAQVWADDTLKRNAQVAVNSLRYVYELQNWNEELVFSVLYDPALPDTKTEAVAFAEAAAQQKLPSGQQLKTELITINSFIAGKSGKVVYVPQGMEKHYDTIYQQAQKNSLFTISSDKSCVEGTCCILAIKTDKSVNIYLNEKTLRKLGFSVNAAFKYMVERV